VITRVEELKMPLDNLVIIHSARICKEVSINELSIAFEKIHCILCRAATLTFKEGWDIGVYFDFKYMEQGTAKLLSAVIREYNDGDMRKEVYDNGIYIHKIPWNPPVEDNNKEFMGQQQEDTTENKRKPRGRAKAQD
jgi:hypothetical protein